MTRAVRERRILKDANGDINDHLRNHIHLTNCIHLKNHMHKHSPILADRSIMRDLVALQKSRSLRDPSTSPPSWHSPSIVDLLARRGDKSVAVGDGRNSVGTEHSRDGRGVSGHSPQLAKPPTSKVAPGEISRRNEGAAAVSDRSSKSGVRDRRRIKREESNGRDLVPDHMGGNEEPLQDGNDFVHNIISGSFESRNKNIKKNERHRQDNHLKTLSEKFNEAPVNSDDAFSHIHLNGRHAQNEKNTGEAETNIRGNCSGSSKVKRRRFRAARRNRASISLRDGVAYNEMSVASNSLAQGAGLPKFCMEEGEDEYAEQNVTRAPGNGCGIPWNWSRIHHRGKSFLDIAGRSFSCGLSDPKLKKDGPVPHGRDVSNMPVMSEYSSSSSKSEAEALPLLVDASGSQGSVDHAAWIHDYSGELGLYADNLLKHEIDTDLASEARSGEQHKFQGHQNGRHQNLTQKYMPRSFRDLVGQNLAAQALSNAVMRRKVGLLYIFYGPHGTGKTSCARIFARALNCQSLENPKPCGFCDSCIAHDMGKSRYIREVGPVSNFDFESIMDILDRMTVSHLSSHYRVFIFDDCDTFSPNSWSAVSKVIDRAPWHVVLILVCSSLDVLPHIIISRCQKFFFPKLKDADIIYTLQWIAAKEDLVIDKDALKLIASRSDGSLRDAAMTLEQLSLLGQRISVPLVQELVGLISDEKLVDLLDLALSADTVNTVKNLREIMESGVEPLALMSQLATVITDILAGSYDFMKGRPRRKFFRRTALSKEDMEKLRQALKTLSEAEKQLRMSNDRLTWLTAALLQLAPDQQYILPSSSADTSFNHSPLGINMTNRRERTRKSSVDRVEASNTERRLAANTSLDNLQPRCSSEVYHDANTRSTSKNRKGHVDLGLVPQQTSSVSGEGRISKQLHGKCRREIEEIWLEVLGMIKINSIKEFMYQEGKLISVSYGPAPTVQLIFSSHKTKSKAEKFRLHILQAFESVLGSPVTIEIRCESRKEIKAEDPHFLPASQDSSSQAYTHSVLRSSKGMPVAGYDNIGSRFVKGRDALNETQLSQLDSAGIGTSEIVEVEASPIEQKGVEHIGARSDRRDAGSAQLGEVAPLSNNSAVASVPEQIKLGEQNWSRSLVRSKVSLAHVIQQAEGCAQRSGWSKSKAVSIAEKLEQENLRLEPSSRSLLCWKATKATHRKLTRLKIRSRRPQTMLKFVSCGKCLCSRSSPR